MGVDERRESHHDRHRQQPAAVIFTYGTLKKGFSNHGLLQDLMQTGDAVFRCNCRTVDPYPLVCGPYRVPFLLNLPGADGANRVFGEMYAVTARGLARLDELEGTVTGHYERLPIEVEPADGGEEIKSVEAYFAERSYALDMWDRCEKIGYSVYGEKESKGYVRRKDRPVNSSFLEQIRQFISPGEN